MSSLCLCGPGGDSLQRGYKTKNEDEDTVGRKRDEQGSGGYSINEIREHTNTVDFCQ